MVDNIKSEDYKRLLDKVDKVVNEKKLDVNVEEDLCIGIMNLIGIEEHLFFTAEKTNKPEYFKLLNEVRKMRVELLKKIIKEPEGELWCTSKHLLSASMRLSEVGTKFLKEGKDKEAREFFEKAYNLYNIFWALNLKMTDTKTLKEKGIVAQEDIKKIEQEEKGNYSHQNITDLKSADKGFFSKLGDVVKNVIDCCKE